MQIPDFFLGVQAPGELAHRVEVARESQLIAVEGVARVGASVAAWGSRSSEYGSWTLLLSGWSCSCLAD